MVMTETALDPRARRTLDLLRAGMSTLMESKNLDEISVAELCRSAGVHRTTFYKHFESVPGFATRTFAGLIDELAAVDTDEGGTVAELAAAYRTATVNLLTHIAENRLLYRRLFSAHGDLVFQRVVLDRMVERAELAVRGFARRGIETGTDEATASAMVGASVVAALAVWAAQDDGDTQLRTEEIFRSLPPWWPPGG